MNLSQPKGGNNVGPSGPGPSRTGNFQGRPVRSSVRHLSTSLLLPTRRPITLVRVRRVASGSPARWPGGAGSTLGRDRDGRQRLESDAAEDRLRLDDAYGGRDGLGGDAGPA